MLFSNFLHASASKGSLPTPAKIKVLTTTSDLQSLVVELGADRVEVKSFTDGRQDPHYIEARPIFMTQVASSDLIVAIGLELEAGWLPSVLKGARNSKLMPGSKGYLEVGPHVDKLGVLNYEPGRDQGDVHPDGNPHFLLDPLQAIKAAKAIKDRLCLHDSGYAKYYEDRFSSLKERLEKKTLLWAERIKKTNIKEIITYHETLTYFCERFGLKIRAEFEPKPGVPPTSKHIISLIDEVKKMQAPLALIENFYSDIPAKRIKESVPAFQYELIPVYVRGEKNLNTLDDLYEHLVQVLERLSLKVLQNKS
tara:strand:+ start:930 stop:1856 length:927 start_codon:yes stop_codon:yes gene_type:complete